MQSFYGGKQGFSFSIVENFPSVAEMVTEFQKGPAYSTVNFDEYVLINTTVKNDPDNGKIFRRGYSYTDELGGAIYLGSIVGPAGMAPMLELTTIDQVLEKGEDAYEVRKGTGEYTPAGQNIVPGKEPDGTFNDSIEWAYCSVRDENGDDTTAYIGFKIPYAVFEFTSESVSAYTNETLVTKTDDNTHPFFSKWNLKIPKGIKGESVNNFRIMVSSLDVETYPGQEDDITNQREILVYDYYDYAESANPTPKTIYFGDYNIIDGVNISEDGTITIDYSHNDTTSFDNVLKYISSISLTQNGLFTVKYNNGDSDYSTTLKWVNNITINDNGTVFFDLCNGETVDVDVTMKWITNVVFDADGSVVVSYNTGESTVFDKEIQWITSVTLTDDGVFTVKYNNGTPDYTNTFKWVTDVTIAENGTLTISYNNGDPLVKDKYVKLISDISIQTDNGAGEGSGDQKVHITYNTGDTEVIGNGLNYIMDTVITEDYQYLVYFSDPDLRERIVNSGRSFSYQGKDDWCFLGSVKEDSGILIGFNLSTTERPELATSADVIAYLNSQYPSGLSGVDFKGKVVSYGDGEEGKVFYGFDYTLVDGNYKGWYYLGGFDVSVDDFMMFGKTTDSDIQAKKDALATHGVWYIVED